MRRTCQDFEAVQAAGRCSGGAVAPGTPQADDAVHLKVAAARHGIGTAASILHGECRSDWSSLAWRAAVLADLSE
jgi:hypothetical protein